MSADYTIIMIDKSHARVLSESHGYCDDFYGETCRADAIRYVKRVGGKTFKFEDHIYLGRSWRDG